MVQRHYLRVMCLLLAAALLCGCGGTGRQAGAAGDGGKCSLVIEDSPYYTVKPSRIWVDRGSDVTLRVTMKGSRRILSCDYPDYEVEDDTVPEVDGDACQRLTLRRVRYSTVVSISVYAPCVLRYYANGGERLDGGSPEEPVELTGSRSHLRQNTAQGTALFRREGYTLTGWNTLPDGSGTAAGLGSRIDAAEGTVLYAQWEEWTEANCFRWRETEGEAEITGGTDIGESLVLPASLGGLPVTSVAAGAFRGAACRRVVLPESLRRVEALAFEGAAVEELWLFDTLTELTSSSLEGCPLRTLRINAARPPVYSGTYFDTFPDKMDRLRSLRGQRKLVLFSGSSTRFGYDSPAIAAAFPDYAVANMGIYAYSSALPQYLLMLEFMDEGDILVSAPEFDAILEQFCATGNLWYEFFAMTEADYDLVSLLDLGEFTGVLDDFAAFQKARSGLRGKGYEVSAANRDEDGNRVAGFVTYNEYGDYIYPRPNQERDGLFGIKRASYRREDFPAETVESLNRVFRRFLDRGIAVWFTYSPRSEKSVTPGSGAAERARLDLWLRETLAVPVVSDIEESLYSGIYFYGTDNHLSDEGVKIRTARSIADFQLQLQRQGGLNHSCSQAEKLPAQKLITTPMAFPIP